MILVSKSACKIYLSISPNESDRLLGRSSILQKWWLSGTTGTCRVLCATAANSRWIMVCHTSGRRLISPVLKKKVLSSQFKDFFPYSQPKKKKLSVFLIANHQTVIQMQIHFSKNVNSKTLTIYLPILFPLFPPIQKNSNLGEKTRSCSIK